MKRRDEKYQRDSQQSALTIREQSDTINQLYTEFERMMDDVVEKMLTKVDQYKPDASKPRSDRSRLVVFPDKRASQSLYEWLVRHQDD